jgi:hypothetical protein
MALDFVDAVHRALRRAGIAGGAVVFVDDRKIPRLFFAVGFAGLEIIIHLNRHGYSPVEFGIRECANPLGF